MVNVKNALYLIIAVMTLSNCGGGGGGSGTPGTGSTSEQGVRIHLASGSTATAEIYGGPVPNSGDEWNIAQTPASYGYVHLGSLGPSSALSSDITGTGQYQYILILVHYGLGSSSPSSPHLRIDAIQRLSDGMYMTGMTNTGYAFYSTNDWNDDSLFQSTTNPSYNLGAPDSRYVAVFGWELIPLIDWAQ